MDNYRWPGPCPSIRTYVAAHMYALYSGKAKGLRNTKEINFLNLTNSVGHYTFKLIMSFDSHTQSKPGHSDLKYLILFCNSTNLNPHIP